MATPLCRVTRRGRGSVMVRCVGAVLRTRDEVGGALFGVEHEPPVLSRGILQIDSRYFLSSAASVGRKSARFRMIETGLRCPSASTPSARGHAVVAGGESVLLARRLCAAPAPRAEACVRSAGWKAKRSIRPSHPGLPKFFFMCVPFWRHSLIVDCIKDLCRRGVRARLVPPPEPVKRGGRAHAVNERRTCAAVKDIATTRGACARKLPEGRAGA